METYRFRLAEILEKIEDVRNALKDLAIAIDGSSREPWYECVWQWERLGDDLAESLEWAAKEDKELRDALYRRAIEGFGPTAAERSDSANRAADLLDEADSHDDPDDTLSRPEPQLSLRLKQALEFIKERGPVKAVVIANHIKVSHPGFRSRYVPKLKALGVRNDGDGYYFPTE